MTTVSPPRKLPFWLIVSVMLNMLLIGLIIGAMVNAGTPDQRRGPGPGRVLTQDLSEADRQQVGEILRAGSAATQDQRHVRAQARMALADAVSREPYDRVAVDAAFANLRAAEADMVEAMHAHMAPQLETLSTAQRAALAQAVARGPRGRRGRNGRGEHRGDGPHGQKPPPSQ